MSLRTTFLSLLAAVAASVPAAAQNASTQAISHVAIFRFDRADIDTAMRAFQALATASRRDAGNLTYDIYRGTDDPQEFYVVERWASQSALDAHQRGEAFLKYGVGVLTRHATLHVAVTASAFDVSG
jgi:quinol monooxygenase YgiN